MNYGSWRHSWIQQFMARSDPWIGPRTVALIIVDRIHSVDIDGIPEEDIPFICSLLLAISSSPDQLLQNADRALEEACEMIRQLENTSEITPYIPNVTLPHSVGDVHATITAVLLFCYVSDFVNDIDARIRGTSWRAFDLLSRANIEPNEAWVIINRIVSMYYLRHYLRCIRQINQLLPGQNRYHELRLAPHVTLQDRVRWHVNYRSGQPPLPAPSEDDDDDLLQVDEGDFLPEHLRVELPDLRFLFYR